MRTSTKRVDIRAKIEAFLTDLAVHGNVAPATQNQAMNALVFLYKRVLKHPLEGSIDAVRAQAKINLPVVMTREEVAAVLSLMNAPQLVTKLLYGSGLRILEAVRLTATRHRHPHHSATARAQRCGYHHDLHPCP